MTTQHMVISIGNTDNKLTQAEWSRFVKDVQKIIENTKCVIHFAAGAPTEMPWQNYAWIIEVDINQFAHLIHYLVDCRRAYKQDSVFILSGSGQML